MNAKDTLAAAGGLGIFIALLLVSIGLGAAFILGSLWVSIHLLPWLTVASLAVFMIVVFVILPLAIPRATRKLSSIALFLASYVFGATLWMEGLLLTYFIWGLFAVFLGLFMAGVGIVPVAMLATLIKGMWTPLIELILLTIATFGCRIGAFALATSVS